MSSFAFTGGHIDSPRQELWKIIFHFNIEIRMLTSFLAKSYMFLRKPVRLNHSVATAGIQNKEQNKTRQLWIQYLKYLKMICLSKI